MPLDELQLTALRVILGACADECARSPLGNLLEGHLKVVAAEALLHSGYSLLESANQKDQGRVVSLRHGKLVAQLEPRTTIDAFPDSGKAKMSPDLRVWSPCRLVVELQVRSSFGSQSALFSENLFDDLRRVGNSLVDALVFAADRPIYDALRGVKSETRGRKAKYASTMPLMLPSSESLATFSPRAWSPVPRLADSMNVAGTLVSTAFGVERCVIGVWKAS